MFDEWSCANGRQCIRRLKRCDGIVDCLDNSDEFACGGSNPGSVIDLKCLSTQFACESEYKCIALSRRCDGYEVSIKSKP